MEKNNRAWLMVVACCALTMSAGMTLNCAGQYLMPIVRELGFGMGQLALYFTVQGICMAIAAPFVGRLMQKVNIRLLLAGCFILSMLGFAGLGFGTKVWHWYIGGAVYGFFGAFCQLMPAPIILSNWFAKRTGFVIGIAMAFTGVGGAIMNPIVANLIQTIGWRTTYMINAGVATVIALPFMLFVLNFKPADRGLKPYGYEEKAAGADTAGPATLPGVPAAAATKSFAFVCLFIVFGLIAFTANFSQQFAPYAASIGLTATIGGTMASANMIGNIVGKIGLGVIADKYGVKVMIVFGMCGVLASFVLLLVSGGAVPLILTATLLAGLAASMSSVASPLLARSIFGSKDYSTIFSTLSISQTAVGAFGMAIIGAVFDATGSYGPTFMIGGVVAVIALVLALTAVTAGKKLKWE